MEETTYIKRGLCQLIIRGLIICFKFVIELLFLIGWIFVMCKVMLNTLNYEVQTLFPQTPRHIGREVSEEHQIADDEFNQLFFEGFHYPGTIESTKEAKDLLLFKLFPYHNVENLGPYRDILLQFPLSLLERMVEDELIIILSERPPVEVEGSQDEFVLGYYQRRSNQIILTNSNYSPGALIHEVGHWVEAYIKRHLDLYCQSRIKPQMKAELAHLGLSEHFYDYAQTNKHEYFAVAFETFILSPQLTQEKAPITAEYFQYYLTQMISQS